MTADLSLHEAALRRAAGLHQAGALPDAEFRLIERLLIADRHRLVDPPPGWFYRPPRSLTWIIGLGEDGPRPARPLRGMGYLQFLLRHPNRDIPALQVAHHGRLDEGQLRQLFHENGKARAAVTMALSRVRKLLPERLAAHLGETIFTGALCGYHPEPQRIPRWRLEP